MLKRLETIITSTIQITVTVAIIAIVYTPWAIKTTCH